MPFPFLLSLYLLLILCLFSWFGTLANSTAGPITCMFPVSPMRSAVGGGGAAASSRPAPRRPTGRLHTHGVSVHSCTQRVESLPTPSPVPDVNLAVQATPGGLKWHLTVPARWVSLTISHIGFLFLSLLAIRTASFRKCLQISCHFFFN